MGTTPEIGTGGLEGVGEGGVLAFRGIPFARPPLGALRFQPPQPPEPWSGARDARRFGAAAPQTADPIGPSIGLEQAPWGEDCLTLNVWTPATDGGRRPVLVWIHGGAFVIGSGAQPVFDGSTLARRGGVVVVTINYRLGVLGFLRLADTPLGRALPTTGNEGMLDHNPSETCARWNGGILCGESTWRRARARPVRSRVRPVTSLAPASSPRPGGAAPW